MCEPKLGNLPKYLNFLVRTWIVLGRPYVSEEGQVKELAIILALITLGSSLAVTIGSIESNERAAILNRMAEIQKETDSLIGRP